MKLNKQCIIIDERDPVVYFVQTMKSLRANGLNLYKAWEQEGLFRASYEKGGKILTIKQDPKGISLESFDLHLLNESKKALELI